VSYTAKFTTNSLFRHIIEMSLSSTAGLFSLFIIDIFDVYFLNKLGAAQAAGVSFASALLVFTIALNVGLSITMGAKVSYALGAGDLEGAARSRNNIYTYAMIINLVILVITFPLIKTGLILIGATGEALVYGQEYLSIMLPSTLLLSLSMNGTAILRALGRPKVAIIPSVLSAIINIACIPLFVFTLNMGVSGTAIASVLARLVSTLIIFYLCNKYTSLMKAPFRWRDFYHSIQGLTQVALPAIITSFANPLAGFIATKAIAKYGNSAVVGYSIISRLIPLAFTIIISYHSSIGPIFSQNYGAKLYDRVKETLVKSAIFSAVIVIIATCILNIFHEQIYNFFEVDQLATELIIFFCKYLAIWYLAMGLLFIALTGFNNLGKAKYSTYLNFGRATFGTIPFVVIGGYLGGPIGILIGQTLGNTIFGIGAFIWCYLYVNKLRKI
jgi:putative MATE family efflux protein